MEIFHIGLAIKKIISKIPNISAHLKSNSFPLVAPAGTEFPFITYRRTSGSLTDMQKDYQEESATVELKLYCDKYEESVRIMHNIANGFVSLWQNYVPEQTDSPEQREIMRAIEDIELTQSTEEFYNDIYIQTIYLEFTFK